MRKFRLLSLVLAGTLALSACGNNASAVNEGSDITEREEDDREDEDREDVDRESHDADGESQQPVKDWGYPLILPEYIIGEVTVGENVYTVYSSEDLFTDEPIEFAEVTAYDPNSIEETVELDGKEYPVIIYGEVINDEVTEIDVPSFIWEIQGFFLHNARNVTSVTLHEGLGWIGQGVFKHSKIETIELPASLISLGAYAFAECENLRSVTFSENSSFKNIENHTFASCSSLTEITIPASVVKINDNAFKGCDNLENIYFENTEGWQNKPSSGGDFVDMDVTDPEENAEMFTGDYCDYIWSR